MRMGVQMKWVVWHSRCRLCGEWISNYKWQIYGAKCRESRRKYRRRHGERAATTDLDQAWDLIRKIFNYLTFYKIDCGGNRKIVYRIVLNIQCECEKLDDLDPKASMVAAMDCVIGLYHIVAKSPKQCSQDLRIYPLLSECFKVLGMDSWAHHVMNVNRNQAIYLLMGISKRDYRRRRHLKSMKKWLDRYNRRREELIREHHGYDGALWEWKEYP